MASFSVFALRVSTIGLNSLSDQALRTSHALLSSSIHSSHANSWDMPDLSRIAQYDLSAKSNGKVTLRAMIISSANPDHCHCLFCQNNQPPPPPPPGFFDSHLCVRRIKNILLTYPNCGCFMVVFPGDANMSHMPPIAQLHLGIGLGFLQI